MVERLPGVAQRRGEAAAIIIAEVALVVIPVGYHHAFLGQDLAKELEMDYLVVHQDAIEVEDHRLDHVALTVASGQLSVASNWCPAQLECQGLPFSPTYWPLATLQIASGPRSPVRMRMQSSRGRMKILPSPILPSGPLRPASRMAFTVGSTKSSFTAI